MPIPMLRTTRPIHVETMFRDRSRAPSLSSSHRSADSVSSSVASPADSSYDAASKFQELRALSPAFEESDDRSSLRSFAMSFSVKRPKWRLLDKLHRRNPAAIERSASAQGGRIPRKLSLAQLHGRSNSSMLQLSPKPASPLQTQADLSQELSCRKCYYSIARNCPGWVMGGSHGDACESCLVCLRPHPTS